MKANGITNILVVGIGGQGVMTASEILAQAARAQGYDVKKTEVAGMAQRGGVVTSHVRFGARVYAPGFGVGQGHVLVGFEPAEAMRWRHYLTAEGIALVNTQRIPPPVVSTGLHPYPDDPIGAMRDAGTRVRAFDAGSIARDLGDARMVNTVMMGAIADHLPFAPDVLKEIIVEGFRARKPKVAELNGLAFDAGRKAAHAAG